MTDLVDLVEDARIKLGLTQSELAKRLGVSQPHYSKVASGTARHSQPLGDRMHEWLGEVGHSDPAPTQRRARELSRSIQRQSRELAALLAGSATAGTRRHVSRARRSGNRSA